MRTLIIQGVFISQAFFAWNQKVIVELSVNPEQIAVNEVIKITVRSNAEGDIIENWPAEFIKMQRTQSSWQYIQDVKLGTTKQEYSVVFSGSFNKKGTYQIGPFYLKTDHKTDHKTYASNVLTIEVQEIKQKHYNEVLANYTTKKKAFGIINISDSIIYEGEPVVVCGKVFSRERTHGSPILKRKYVINGVDDSHVITHDHQWETVMIKDQEYLSFIFDKKVIFPTGNKNVSINPFDIYLPYSLYGVHVRSSATSIRVMPLPTDSPSNFIGAVGHFEVKQNCRSTKIKPGDIVEVEVVVSGQGNLHAIDAPQVKFPNSITVYGSPQIEEDYEFCSHGARGKITYVYPIQIDKEGKYVIEPVSIAYFDPKLKKYVQTQANKALEINVETIDKLQLQDMTADNPAMDLSSDERIATNTVRASKSSNAWLWSLGTSLSIVMCSGLFIIVVRRKRNKTTKKNKANANSAPLNNAAYMETIVKDLIHQTSFYCREQQRDNFYICMEKTLIAVLKFKVQEGKDSTLSRNELLNLFREIHKPYADHIERLFLECDAARYGQITTSISQEKMLEDLRRMV